jgi:hypothetical protein
MLALSTQGRAMRHTTKNLKNRRRLQKIEKKLRSQAKALKRQARRSPKNSAAG